MPLPITSIEEIAPVDLLEDYRKRRTIAALTGYCEGLVSSGLLGEQIEQSLRERIVAAQNAFNIPTIAERTS